MVIRTGVFVRLMGYCPHGIHSVPAGAEGSGAGAGQAVHLPLEFGIENYLFGGVHQRVVPVNLFLRQGRNRRKQGGCCRSIRCIVSPGMAFHDPASCRMSGDIGDSFTELKNIGAHFFQGCQIFRAGFQRHKVSLLHDGFHVRANATEIFFRPQLTTQFKDIVES